MKPSYWANYVILVLGVGIASPHRVPLSFLTCKALIFLFCKMAGLNPLQVSVFTHEYMKLQLN